VIGLPRFDGFATVQEAYRIVESFGDESAPVTVSYQIAENLSDQGDLAAALPYSGTRSRASSSAANSGALRM